MGSFTRLTYHVVFGTKYRKPRLNDEFRESMYEYIGGVIRSEKGHPVAIGGIEDHVHLLLNIPPKLAVSEMIRTLKSNSSKWVNALPANVRKMTSKFQWQIGYGAFTVSYSNCDAVQTYIQNQREHHHKQSFEEEFIELLERHGIEFERKYLWEGEHTG